VDDVIPAVPDDNEELDISSQPARSSQRVKRAIEATDSEDDSEEVNLLQLIKMNKKNY
jgi:hypothetical protein